MDLWFSEFHTDDVKLSIRVDKHLHSEQSEFQRIDVFESIEFGRILVIDGFVMLTEKDEFIYHEMIVHPALAVSPDIKNVLVIGAGDGGTVRELCRYKEIEHIDVAEIDGRVIEVCKEYLKQTASGFNDPRVTVNVADGLRFVRKCEGCYDLIIVDSTDPFGPGEGLFTAEFYGNCKNALTPRGILINQHESPFYSNDAKAVTRAHKRISGVFDGVWVYQLSIPTYPSGHWLFGFSSDAFNPLEFDAARWNERGLETRYYNTELHRGAFALPNYVKGLLL
jgi:spermidine synthase